MVSFLCGNLLYKDWFSSVFYTADETPCSYRSLFKRSDIVSLFSNVAVVNFIKFNLVVGSRVGA